MLSSKMGIAIDQLNAINMEFGANDISKLIDYNYAETTEHERLSRDAILR
jgi:hypothetical protein